VGKIELDSQNSNYSNAEKVEILVTIAQLYVAEEMYREAEIFVNKTATYINRPGIDEIWKLKYWSSMASVQDANQKYHQAAFGYLRLSEKLENPEESLEKLEKGMKCTILSPAGPNRARLLLKFYKDEKSAGLPGFKVVEKMFTERLIYKSDFEVFEQTLAEHQTRQTKEGWTLLQKAVIEHNLIATSKLYTNILLTDLATILGVDVKGAESTVANMIVQGRLTGKIDQAKGILHFDTTHILRNWDTNIEIATGSVNNIVDRLNAKFPNNNWRTV